MDRIGGGLLIRYTKLIANKRLVMPHCAPGTVWQHFVHILMETREEWMPKVKGDGSEGMLMF